VSPDGRYAIHSWSAFSRPGDTELISLPDHKTLRVLADNSKLREKIESLVSGPIELFRVDIGEGVALDGWCLQPPVVAPDKTYPLLIHVYGEPAGQTVLDQWGGKGFLWHLMLAQQGWFVMSFDNRGTPAPRGRDWRKFVHRQVGILAPEDQAAAVRKVLADRPGLDPDRVGIWGWSGGGSMTLNALFKFPKLYRTGIAIASVPNQRYYDSIYQERYMGLPQDNVDGFHNGSSINFAGQLEGHLLLIHGTGDDNVHYQGAEALVNELVRHNKQFQLMAYPNRTHSISERSGTTLHLRQLMTDYLREHLPPGPRDRTLDVRF
jgi:dipeptidyl-peptidase-4